MTKSIEYYNNNTQAFYDRTINADISNSYEAFLKKLPNNSHILDAGCGVGRDSKYFLNHGHKVTAFDASEKMVTLASKETGLTVKKLTFQDMNFDEIFDGVWAQASLLHVPYQETSKVYESIYRALKPCGIFYASYKYGQDHMPTLERDFWNMNEENVKPYLEGIFDIVEIWKEKDIRSKVSPSKDSMWLNFIVKKSPSIQNSFNRFIV